MARGKAGAGARAKGIRNKQKRVATFAKFAKQGEKEQKKERKKRQKEAEELGEEAAPRKAQRTLDNTREPDETVVQPDDAEVAADAVAASPAKKAKSQTPHEWYKDLKKKAKEQEAEAHAHGFKQMHQGLRRRLTNLRYKSSFLSISRLTLWPRLP